jgi:phosphotriesterase-related protein
MPIVRTVLGDVPPSRLGVTLIHEHLVVDVRPPAGIGCRVPAGGWGGVRPPEYADDLETIVGPMLPHLRAVREQGVRTVVDCTPTDLGRHPLAYRTVAERTGLHVVMACGTYRDGWLLDWQKSAPEEELAEWYGGGLRDGAGFIKLGCDPDGPSPAEARCARAAGTASRRTGAMVACHVGQAGPANRVIEAFEAGGGDPARFVVVHVQNEPDPDAHLALARRGAWVEYDGIGASPPDVQYVVWLRALAEAGLLGRALISQDACAYIVGPDGAVERQHRFDRLLGSFVPALRRAGFSPAEVDRLLVANPARALAIGA